MHRRHLGIIAREYFLFKSFCRPASLSKSHVPWDRCRHLRTCVKPNILFGEATPLMEEILDHLGGMKLCKLWDIYNINWLAGFLNHQRYDIALNWPVNLFLAGFCSLNVLICEAGSMLPARADGKKAGLWSCSALPMGPGHERVMNNATNERPRNVETVHEPYSPSFFYLRFQL